MKQETPEEKTDFDKLKEEAAQFYNLAKDYRRDRLMKDETQVYIISKVWLQKWKEYVNYGFVKRNIQYTYYYSQYNKNKYEPKLSCNPGEIDNSRILVPLSDFLNDGDASNPENIVIKHEINQKKEIRIVNKAIWTFFQEKYGGGPEILKGTIGEKSKYNTMPKKIVEIFFRKLNIVFLPKRKEFTPENINQIKSETIYISRAKSIVDLKSKICSLYQNKSFTSVEGVSEKNIRLWKLNANATLQQFKHVFSEKSENVRDSDIQFKCGDLSFLEYNDKAQLEDIELADTDLCVVEYSTETSSLIFEVKKMEQKEGFCDWCNHRRILRFFCQCKEVWYCKEECLDKDKLIHQGRCKKRFEVDDGDKISENERSRKGLVGLQNLGNTCFMNTSLQCISNCYELTLYFLKDHYKKDINVDNPIGTQGVLAKAYAHFLKSVWYGDNGVFSPWNFKRAISMFQSMFSGYQQHDTQEFLNYLLDGLHEDLNRVFKKPMVEKDDSKKDDELKSKEQWIGFLKRNQSALVDILYGQFKSTLYCPDQECQNVSTTFDPFLSVSLPLVAKTETYEVMCFFIFSDIKIKPLQLTLPFSVETTIMALRNKVGRMLNIHPFSFFVIKMDQYGNYDHMLHSSALLKVNNFFYHANQKPFFLFQIDPELFYTNYNKFCLENEKTLLMKRDFSKIFEEMENREEENKKLFSDDYEEEETGFTSESICYYSRIFYNTFGGRQSSLQKINVDNNYGFDNNFIKVVMLLRKYQGDSVLSRERIIFPRITYLNKKWTTKQTHFYIFTYFAPLIRTYYNLNEDEWPNEKLWNKYFDKIDTNNKNDSYDYHKKSNWPYRLRMKKQSSRSESCYFCGLNCSDCLLPCDDNITISDLLDKIPKNDDLEIDNTYLFLSEKHKFYINNNNKDFQIELTWLQEYSNVVHNLNDKRDFDFKILRTQINQVSIYDCFRNFVKLEKLEEYNEWYCPECKKHQKATKKMEIYKAPHILIVHLKRFRNNSKIDTLVDFPINGLNINSYVICNEGNLPLDYDLFAIANHYGNMGFGHYISFAKNPLTNQWYEFDDSHVSKKNEGDLVTSSAYVLFYRRKGLENFVNFDEIYNKKFVDYNSDSNSAPTTNQSTQVDSNSIANVTHNASNLTLNLQSQNEGSLMNSGNSGPNKMYDEELS